MCAKGDCIPRRRDRTYVGARISDIGGRQPGIPHFDNTFVIVYCLKLQGELDLRQEEVLVFDALSAYQSVEEVQVNHFLDLHHDASEKTAASRRDGQPRWLDLDI
jgi:hypothetical protein